VGPPDHKPLDMHPKEPELSLAFDAKQKCWLKYRAKDGKMKECAINP